jgi:hypothetical protein
VTVGSYQLPRPIQRQSDLRGLSKEGTSGVDSRGLRTPSWSRQATLKLGTCRRDIH